MAYNWREYASIDRSTKGEDQEEILLSSLYITGLAAKKSSGSSGEKALVGGGDGVITLWEKGQWDDQDERIVVSKDKETLDCLTEIPAGIAGFGKKVAVGLGDGKIRIVQLGQNQVVGEMQHDEVEGVIGLDFDVAGRMISGGGQVVKVWREADVDEEAEEDGVAAKRTASGSEDDGDEGSERDSSEAEVQPTRPKKRRKGSEQPAAAMSFAGLD
ncbi:WD repeat-containing protein jip5 [Oleoguttula sp. CCFEE 5521]